ncbi:MAG: DsbA family protein [Solirubrobacterales bacterium]|nr:DsbA family protein [Solirubrobacterales bacterium]
MTTLYVDFNSPYAYLAFERAQHVFGAQPRIEVIALAFLHRHYQRIPWSLKDTEKPEGMADCETRARDYGLPPLRWPPGWPLASYSLAPLRAAHAAAREGALIAFSAAAFRRHFRDGLGLTTDGDIAEVTKHADLDPQTIHAGIESQEVKDSLKNATQRAIELGVPGVPTTQVGERLFWGDDRLAEASGTRLRGTVSSQG